MITLKSPHEIELMRRAGKITAAARAYAGELVKPGVTTHEIDRAVEHFIRKQGAVPSFLHYNGYPASACISVNDEIIHGIPGPRVLLEGDIVSVDVGAYIGGFHGDCAATFPCGRISPEAQDLIDVTRQSFFEGIKFAKEGYRLFDISAAIQQYVESHGYSIVREIRRPRCRRPDARVAGDPQIRPSRPGAQAPPRHDACNRTHGERRFGGHPADERRLVRQDAGRKMGGPL